MISIHGNDELQKQVDFLEKNPHCSLSFHNVLNRYNDRRAEHLYGSPTEKTFFKLEDLLLENVIPATCSIIFRRESITRFPDWIFKLAFGDRTLMTLCAEHGDFGRLDDVMGVYRIHPGGTWSLNGIAEWSQDIQIDRLVSILEYFEASLLHLPRKYSNIIKRQILNLTYEIVWRYQQQKKWDKMRQYLSRAIPAGLLHPNWPSSYVAKAYLVSFLPSIYKLYNVLKKLLDSAPRSI